MNGATTDLLNPFPVNMRGKVFNRGLQQTKYQKDLLQYILCISGKGLDCYPGSFPCKLHGCKAGIIVAVKGSCPVHIR